MSIGGLTNSAEVRQTASEQDEQAIEKLEGVGAGAVDGGTHCDRVCALCKGFDHLHHLHTGMHVLQGIGLATCRAYSSPSVHHTAIFSLKGLHPVLSVQLLLLPHTGLHIGWA